MHVLRTISRLRTRLRQHRHERQAAAAIRRCERAVEKCLRNRAERLRTQDRELLRTGRKARRAAAPGYDELRDPWFFGVMVFAAVVLAFDVSDAWPQLHSLVTAAAGWIGSLNG